MPKREFTDKQRRQFWAQKNALTRVEKELISFYELQYVLRQRVPTIEEVATYCKIPHTEANFYLTKRNIQKALENRGIPWKQHTQGELTPTQIACAITMMNFADTRSNPQKLDQLGITPTQYQAWLNDPQFKNLVDNLKEQNLNNIDNVAVGELTKKIYAGDWQAVKFYLETTGSIQTSEAPQSEVLLKIIVEIIQEEVKDPEVIVRIADRIQRATANRTLERAVERPAITGEVVNVEELEEARKKLGV